MCAYTKALAGLHEFMDGTGAAMGSAYSIPLLEAEVGPLIDGRWVELMVLAVIVITAVLIGGAVLLLARGRRRRSG